MGSRVHLQGSRLRHPWLPDSVLWPFNVHTSEPNSACLRDIILINHRPWNGMENTEYFLCRAPCKPDPELVVDGSLYVAGR